ncbi:HAD family hydrolase [Herpetosiphon llansteffanensis]|uniref:HAD family hydrolase n=1 Tax=Herpetosiphon llansteffanensis TaxID=2094568 RepID=UPI000D7D21D2|nr:HAD family hydrolase [Herpetosiphon llansteffanensis]
MSGRPLVLFDVYGTLVDVHTDEHQPALWQHLAQWLRYRGVVCTAEDLHNKYFTAMQSNLPAHERYPEWQTEQVWAGLLTELGLDPAEAVSMSQLLRVLSIKHLRLFPETKPALELLGQHYQLGIVSDAQRVIALAELAELNILEYFDPSIISSDYAYRKPDPRLFEHALVQAAASANQTWYIGDNLLRDVQGAQLAGLHAAWVKRPQATTEASQHTPDLIVPDLLSFARHLLAQR